MGDINENVGTITGESEEAIAAGNNDGRPSFDLLKETKELADITNVESTVAAAVDEKRSKKMINEKSREVDDKKSEPAANIETVFENTSLDLTAASEAPLQQSPDPPQETANSNEASGNTGRMNKIRDHSSTIFPAGIMGCKEDEGSGMTSPRRFLDAFEVSRDSVGHVANIPRKMSNSKSDHNRNPLTGTGVDCTDEVKRTPSKKKVDGNPLLGVGYIENKTSSSATRIPPGGFSHGLW